MDTILRKPYDFFQAMDRLMSHADELGADERRALKAAVVLNAADPRAVSLHVDLTGDRLGEIYPPNAETPPVTTNAAIDTFLDRYGHSTPEEDALLEKLIFNPVPDYSQVLATGTDSMEDDNPASLASLAADINSIPSSRTGTVVKEDARPPKKEKQPSPAPKRPALTLELAKIFIKQGQFDRAHEIISKISLNNPEKSAYFADQLRFLEKLMLVQRASAAKRGDATPM